MGWRGTLRAMEAANRRALKESERELKRLDKEQEIADAQEAFDLYEEYLKKVTCMHHDVISKPMYWTKLINSNPPPEPKYERAMEDYTRKDLVQHRPSFWVNLLNLRDKKLEILTKRVEDAIARDMEAHSRKLEHNRLELAKWEKDKEFAKRILDDDLEAMTSALHEYIEWSEIPALGTELDIQVLDTETVCIRVKVLSEDIIPTEKYSLTRTGRLVTKDMPGTQFNTIYQDYVCSVALRVASEVFNIISFIEKVIIDAVDMCLDYSTGIKSEQPILSVVIPGEFFLSLNLFDVDPSLAMRNFVHNMAFKKATGFGPVSSLVNAYRNTGSFSMNTRAKLGQHLEGYEDFDESVR